MASPVTQAENPYTTLLHSTQHSPTQITAAYDTHRTTRAADKRAQLTNPTSSPGLIQDPILARLATSPKGTDPATIDARHNLPIWARPPQRVRALVAQIQARLLARLPDLYLPHESHLHMTVVEVTHSRTPAELAPLLAALEGSGAADRVAELAADLARAGRVASLARPRVTYDANAVALSFLPVANGSAAESSEDGAGSTLGEQPQEFTYHHLRGAVFAAMSGAVPVASRYVLPSAHVTVARFTRATPATDAERVAQSVRLVDAVDAVNAWLDAEVQGDRTKGGVWEVGEEKGLELRAGSCWYGYGGRCVRLGRGIRSCTMREVAA